MKIQANLHWPMSKKRARKVNLYLVVKISIDHNSRTASGIGKIFFFGYHS